MQFLNFVHNCQVLYLEKSFVKHKLKPQTV